MQSSHKRKLGFIFHRLESPQQHLRTCESRGEKEIQLTRGVDSDPNPKPNPNPLTLTLSLCAMASRATFDEFDTYARKTSAEGFSHVRQV